ncbi:MAG: ATP-binding protein [Planctomycetota bacterium]
MKYKERLLGRKLRRLAGRFPIVVVSGARQVGKSTLLGHEFPGHDVVVFDPTVDVGNARSDPDLFLQNHPPPIILDEIQYAPELVAALKRQIDRRGEPGQYLLTGSQQWSVLKAVSESLAGRAMFLDLEGLCLAEVTQSVTEDHWLRRYLEDPEKFVATPAVRLPTTHTLFEQLWRGSLPAVDSLEEEWVTDYYSAYMRTYIERDVRLVSEISDWQLFGRFVQLAAALTAQEINHSQLGREIGVTPQTAQRWLTTLRATFQWFELPAYHGNTLKKISARRKGYFGDTGLASSLHMISAPKALAGHPLSGAFFETAAIAEIRKLSRSLSTPPAMYHWRSHSGPEVDLLLERDGRLYPIEFKLASQPARRDTTGINALREAYSGSDIAPALVIAPTDRLARLSESAYSFPWDAQ